MNSGNILYRAEAVVWDRRVTIQIDTYRIERLTPAGYWLRDTRHGGPLVWRHRRATRRFAWATEEQARESLRRRSILRFGYAENRLRDAETVLMALGAWPIPRDDLDLLTLLPGPQF